MRPWAIAATALVAVALVAEVVAVPVASRVLGSALARCLDHDGLNVDSVRRPVVPRLVAGRARDVSLTVHGVEVGGLRLAEVRADVADVRLPWAPGGAVETEATLHLSVVADDLEEWAAGHAPLGLRPSLDIRPGTATIGVGDLPLRLPVEVSVADDVLTVRPRGGDDRLWSALGFAAELRLPEDVRVDRVALDTGRVTSTVRVDVVPGLSEGTEECAGPFASAAA